MFGSFHTNEEKEVVFDILARYHLLFSKEKRHPVIIGNPDFLKIIHPLLEEWGKVAELFIALVDSVYPGLFQVLMFNLRIIIEIIYYLGYQRGQDSKAKQSGSLIFTVGKEEEKGHGGSDRSD